LLPERMTQKHLSGIKMIVGQGGARRRRPEAERFGQDIECLENALAVEKDAFLAARYTFYLAQSYQNAGRPEPALQLYLKRAELGFWDQEVYVSLYRAGMLKVELGYDAEDIIATYLQAQEVDRNRAEALHGAARYCRTQNRFEQGYRFAKAGLKLNGPERGLFVEQWIYDYGLADECAVCAYWLEKFDDCLRICNQLLADGKIPAEMRGRVERNAKFAKDKRLVVKWA
jgi:hypothetical protein